MKQENAVLSTKLRVSELFYSLQGEGRRAGSANTFIRLQGCKAQHACYAAGIRCDTEFESGREMTLGEILDWIGENAHGCRNIIWTGGEPTDQLTDDLCHYLYGKGWFQTVETSGLNPVPKGIDFISISPKVAEHVIQKNFKDDGRSKELRYVRHKGQDIPQPKIEADFLYLSPHSDGFTINGENLRHCIDLCQKNPDWSLSLQQHKIWNVL